MAILADMDVGVKALAYSILPNIGENLFRREGSVGEL